MPGPDYKVPLGVMLASMTPEQREGYEKFRKMADNLPVYEPPFFPNAMRQPGAEWMTDDRDEPLEGEDDV